MDATPVISIVVPVYNAGSYLRPCMDSLIGQTLHEIEIICVLDCPTDGSDRVIEEYAAKDNRIVVIRNEEQLHVGESRNVGLRAARGQYIGFSDHDDLHESVMYERLIELSKGEQVDVIWGAIRYDDNGNEKIKYPPISPNGNEESMYSLYSSCYNTLVTTNLYRKEFLLRNSVLFEDTRVMRAEDLFFNLKVLGCCKKDRMRSLNEPYYTHLMTEESFGYTYAYNNTAKQLVLIDKTLHFLESIEAGEEFIHRFNYLLTLRLYTGFRFEIRENGLLNALKMEKDLMQSNKLCQHLLRNTEIQPVPKATIPKRVFIKMLVFLSKGTCLFENMF